MSDDTSTSSGPQISPRTIGAAAIAVLLIIFVAQNTEEVPIKFLVFDTTRPVWMALSVTLVLAFLLGFLVGRSKTKAKLQ